MKSKAFLNQMLPGLDWFSLDLLLTSQPICLERIRQLLEKRRAPIHNALTWRIRG